MKKKILCFITLFIISFTFNNVKAENTCEGLSDTSLPTLTMSTVGNAIVVSRFEDIFGAWHNSTYYQMRLDGVKALCISPGKSAHSKDKYKYSGVSTDVNHNMAFGFYISNDYPGQEMIKWAISQVVVWNGLNPGTEDTINKLVWGDNSIDYTSRGAVAMEVKISLQKHRGEQYYVWNNVSRDGQQMITSLSGCAEPVKSVCPSGQMQKNDVSLSCYTSKGGNLFSGFSYIAVSGGDGANTNVSVASESGAVGQQMREIGSYCRLYCQEYGTAILPGAIGESLRLGSYIVWPTSSSNSTSKFTKESFPLKFTGELQCKIGVIPDKGLPFACERDPVSEYFDAYNYVNTHKGVPTYNRTVNNDLEKMRLSITTWGANDSAPSKETIRAACTDAYNKNYTNIIYQYQKAKDLLEEARQKESAIEPKYQDKYCYDEKTGFSHYCGKEETEAYRKAKDYTNDKLDIFSSIENAIDACTTYTLKFEQARQILKEYKTCAEYTASTDLYQFQTSVLLDYTDEEYKNIGDVVAEKTETSTAGQIDGNKSLISDNVKNNKLRFDDLYVQKDANSGEVTNIVNSIKSREFTITKSVTYSLITDYKYIDKDTQKYLTEATKGNNYSSIYTISNGNLTKDNGVIPTSYNNKLAYDYDLTLSNISFGGLTQFGNSATYICPVQFTKVSNTTCLCPEGTENEGMDLTGLIANNKVTCADAQVLYCDKSNLDVPETDLYCPNMPDVSIGACVNSGYTKDECINKICTKKYTCKNTNNVGGKMDITSCVQTKMMQGLTEKEAIDHCDFAVCPIGRTIIYRTIKLENPFPSKDADATVKQTNLQVGMFNNNLKGRYPGSNWNGILTVYNKIRNNRGTPTKDTNKAINTKTGLVGTTIYQKKKPLYTFVLNGTTINEIRNYNDKQQSGYNDFKLDCKISNSTACVSSFVHNSIYGLVSGECYGNTNSNDFYTCAGR